MRSVIFILSLIPNTFCVYITNVFIAAAYRGQNVKVQKMIKDEKKRIAEEYTPDDSNPNIREEKLQEFFGQREPLCLQTALHYATANNKIKVVQVLINAKADLELVQNSGLMRGSALHIAAFLGHTEIAKLLIDSKANIELRDSMGSTPLCVAVRDRTVREETAKMFIAEGADVDIVLKDDALHDYRKDILRKFILEVRGELTKACKERAKAEGKGKAPASVLTVLTAGGSGAAPKTSYVSDRNLTDTASHSITQIYQNVV
jgi:hypothetical protein